MQFGKRYLHKVTALFSILLLILATAPVSTGQVLPKKPVLGSVSTTGGVQLRGAGVYGESTVFSGDQISSGADGSANILLGRGQKLILDHSTDINVAQEGRGIQVRMRS